MNDSDYKGPVYRSQDKKIKSTLANSSFHKPILSDQALEIPAYVKKNPRHKNWGSQTSQRSETFSLTQSDWPSNQSVFPVNNHHPELSSNRSPKAERESSIPFLEKKNQSSSLSNDQLNKRLQEHADRDSSVQTSYMDTIPSQVSNRWKDLREEALKNGARNTESRSSSLRNQDQSFADKPIEAHSSVEVSRELLQRLVKPKDKYILLEEGAQYDE